MLEEHRRELAEIVCSISNDSNDAHPMLQQTELDWYQKFSGRLSPNLL